MAISENEGEYTPLWTAWSSLGREYRSFLANNQGNAAPALNQLLGNIRQRAFVTHGSKAGQIIRHIASDNMQRGIGASLYFRAKPNEQVFNNRAKAQQEGMLAAWAQDNGLDSRSAARSREVLRRAAGEMADREQEHHETLETLEQQFVDHLRDARAEASSAQEQFQAWRDEVSDQIHADRGAWDSAVKGDRSRWEIEWRTQYDLYVEQLKIRAAVEQWKERAAEHDKAFERVRWWTIGIGVLGLAGAVAWSALSLDLAEWLFSNALVTGKAKLVPGTLRPTWLHEVIFAASASLLYLTQYLWAMRLLVRSMISEQHLGVDARSRASMAHTYLALTEQQVADEKDRAIVLASLFRPVTDGLVKDDALPLISPATVLSGTLAGK